MKTYTWPEAWDLMVNHGKKITRYGWEGYIIFCKNRYAFVDECWEIFDITYFVTVLTDFMEFEEPVKFEWQENRDDNKPREGSLVFIRLLGKFSNRYSSTIYYGQNKWDCVFDEDIIHWSYIPEPEEK